MNKQNRKWMTVGVVAGLLLQTSPAWAFEELFQNAMTFLSGPFGFVLGALGLGVAAVAYIFGGEKHLPRVIAAAVGSLLVMGAPKILQTIQGWAH
jgi:type IV secretory pathway VirB2 component (pilin)